MSETEHLQGKRMDLTFRLTASTVCLESPTAEAVEYDLSDDRPCRIASTEKENVERFSFGDDLHGPSSLAALRQTREQWATHLRLSSAAILDKKCKQPSRAFQVHGIDHRPALLAGGNQPSPRQDCQM
jgi:hypothetical protein